jgi:hypothetical protein
LKVCKDLYLKDLSSSFPGPISGAQVDDMVSQADKNHLIEEALTVESFKQTGAGLKVGRVR